MIVMDLHSSHPGFVEFDTPPDYYLVDHKLFGGNTRLNLRLKLKFFFGSLPRPPETCSGFVFVEQIDCFGLSVVASRPSDCYWLCEIDSCKFYSVALLDHNSVAVVVAWFSSFGIYHNFTVFIQAPRENGFYIFAIDSLMGGVSRSDIVGLYRGFNISCVGIIFCTNDLC